MDSIIGLTGSFGSGCSFLVEKFFLPQGYKLYSLSKKLKDLYSKETDISTNRTILQDFGNQLRKDNGPNYLAKLVIDDIKKDLKQNKNSFSKVIIDSIRNPNEIAFFRQEYQNFFLFGIYANQEIRWGRVKNFPQYNQDRKIFDSDDDRDKGEDFDYGQKVTDCFLHADIIINNESQIYQDNLNYEFMRDKLNQLIDLTTGKYKRVPTEQEALMAIAFANSQRSNCLKRKVGAIIIDSKGHILGSGYNEVPSFMKPCKEEFGNCYRGMLRKKWADKVKNTVSDSPIQDNLIEYFNDEFKILDYCRSLHAEESAILSIAMNGSSALKGAALYTSTYPCNLCANKIREVGIEKIFYLEPYPMPEAKKILEGITQIPFEGVTYNGFFRLFRG